MVPRIGAFEISINGTLLFSKCLSGLWPQGEGFAVISKNVAEAIETGKDLTEF